MIINTIGFALKIVIAAGLIVPLTVPKTSLISADKIAVYALIAAVASAMTSISKFMEAGIIAGAFLITVGIISYSYIKRLDEWPDGLIGITPFWLVTVIGMCVGAGMIFQAILLTAIAYYIINYLPELLSNRKKSSKKNTTTS
ncbi:MAG: hypothetical protein ACE5EE_04400 [Fidelibacterota bacterium]